MSNYFVRVLDVEDDVVLLRPEEISSVVEYRHEHMNYDYVVMKNGSHFEIAPGQLSFDCLVNHTQHAGVRVLC